MPLAQPVAAEKEDSLKQLSLRLCRQALPGRASGSVKNVIKSVFFQLRCTFGVTLVWFRVSGEVAGPSRTFQGCPPGVSCARLAPCKVPQHH